MTRGTLAWAAVAWLPFLTALLIFEGPALRRNLRPRLPTLRFPNVPLRAFRFRVTIRWTNGNVTEQVITRGRLTMKRTWLELLELPKRADVAICTIGPADREARRESFSRSRE